MKRPFKGRHGYATRQAMLHWMEVHRKSKSEVDLSLQANPDPKAPLYFWQLYSLMGEDRIEGIVRAFYTRVFKDRENPEFQKPFILASITSSWERHIAAMTDFWIDAFGGGEAFDGGDDRIAQHHALNAKEVMNAEGARRWMFHMGKALNEDTDWSGLDPRCKGALWSFCIRACASMRPHIPGSSIRVTLTPSMTWT